MPPGGAPPRSSWQNAARHGCVASLAHLRRRLVAMCLRSLGLFFQPAISADAPLLP